MRGMICCCWWKWLQVSGLSHRCVKSSVVVGMLTYCWLVWHQQLNAGGSKNLCSASSQCYTLPDALFSWFCSRKESYFHWHWKSLRGGIGRGHERWQAIAGGHSCGNGRTPVYGEEEGKCTAVCWILACVREVWNYTVQRTSILLFHKTLQAL